MYCTKSVLTSVLFLILFSGTLIAQKKEPDLKLNFPESLKAIGESNSFSTYKALAVFFPINPIFLIENKKFYVGVTKEFSFGKFPFGRAAVEYSLIFRKTHLNQLRFSYNFDIPLETADLGAFLVSAGGGYFTDFNKEGYFPQISANVMLPLYDEVGIFLYTKFRYTFMTDKNESDIFDFSLGLSTFIYF